MKCCFGGAKRHFSRESVAGLASGRRCLFVSTWARSARRVRERRCRQMLLAIVIAVASVAIGTGLALGFGADRAWILGPVRNFALAAVLVAVVLDLLPESLAGAGAPVLLAFVGGMVGPAALTRVGRWLGAAGSDDSDLAMEIGYIGLLLHKLGDGFALAVFAGVGAGTAAHYDAVMALGLHAIPVTAVIVMAFASGRGPGSAIARAVGLAAATLVGVGIAVASAGGDWLAAAAPWINAAAAGLLLHILVHDLPPHPIPRHRVGARALHLAALAAGVAAALLSGHHEPGAVHAGDAIAEALAALVTDIAPPLALGLAIGGLVHVAGAKVPTRWLGAGARTRGAVIDATRGAVIDATRGAVIDATRGAVIDATRGAVLGAPLPVCACGVVPAAKSLRARGASAALVLAFALGAPQLGAESFLLTAQMFGWPMAATRLGAVLVMAVVAAMAAAMVVAAAARATRALPADGAASRSPSEGAAELMAPYEAADDARGAAPRLLAFIDAMLLHTGPWIAAGLVVAAYVHVFVAPGALAELGGSLAAELAIVAVVAAPSYLCAPAAIPLIAALAAKGLSPGAALIGLLLGPSLNLVALGHVRQSYTRRAAWALIAAALAVALAAALAVESVASLPIHGLASGARLGGGATWTGTVAAAALAVAVVRSLWRSGVDMWLASLGSLRGQGPGRAHDHGHGHAH
jgi:hypothetical protein